MRLLVFAIAMSLLFPIAGWAQSITEHDLRGHIEVLASDNFGGRKPGTEGENKTVNYIAVQWAKAGLTPAANGSWYAPVTLVERRPVEQNFSFFRTVREHSKAINIDEHEIILRGATADVKLSNMQIAYAGYGKETVEELEKAVSGKLVLLGISAPKGDEKGDEFPDYRTRKTQLIAAGAVGVITVIDGARSWKRTARRYRTAGTNLEGEQYHADVEGIISKKQAKKLLRKVRVDAGQLFKKSKAITFRTLDLPIQADFSLETAVHSFISHNVIGKISGKKAGSGAVLFMGHWDHFGECRVEDKSNPNKDRICNGAVDNASGISLLIETAKRLAGEKHDRDIYFLATTAEEKGLLGARAFVKNPAFTLDELVAVFNADTVALAPNGKLLAVVGRGETDLDADIEKVAKDEEREIDKTDKANAFLKRQDGYVFLEKGIPAFMITSAFSDQERLDTYLQGRYHDVSDEADEGLLLGGAADDANFHVALGRYFGSTDSFPAKGH